MKNSNDFKTEFERKNFGYYEKILGTSPRKFHMKSFVRYNEKITSSPMLGRYYCCQLLILACSILLTRRYSDGRARWPNIGEFTPHALHELQANKFTYILCQASFWPTTYYRNIFPPRDLFFSVSKISWNYSPRFRKISTKDKVTFQHQKKMGGYSVS